MLLWWGWLYQTPIWLASLSLNCSTPEIKGQTTTDLPGSPILCSTDLLQAHVLWIWKRVSNMVVSGLHRWENKSYVELTISPFFTEFFLVIWFLPSLWQLQATLIFHSSVFQYCKIQGFSYYDENQMTVRHLYLMFWVCILSQELPLTTTKAFLFCQFLAEYRFKYKALKRCCIFNFKPDNISSGPTILNPL